MRGCFEKIKFFSKQSQGQSLFKGKNMLVTLLVILICPVMFLSKTNLNDFKVIKPLHSYTFKL